MIRKLTQTRSLLDDVLAIVFAVLFGLMFVVMATIYVPTLAGEWWYWCLFLVPVAVVVVKVRAIRKELNVRRQIANGQIEVTQVGEGPGAFRITMSAEEKERRERDFRKMIDDIFAKNKGESHING